MSRREVHVGESMADGWYYLKTGASSGEQAGPITWAELYRLGASGVLMPQTMVWHQALPQWTPASLVPGLFAKAGQREVPPSYAMPALPSSAPATAPGAPPVGRRPRRWLVPVILSAAVVIAAAIALGTYFGLSRDGGDGSTAGTTVAAEGEVVDLGVAEAADGDPDLVVETEEYGTGPADQVLVMMAAGSGRTEAEAVAATLGGTIVGRVEYIQLYQVQTAGTTAEDLTAAIQTAAAQPGVEAAFPNLIMAFDTTIEGSKCSPLRDPLYDGANAIPFNMIGLQQAWDLIKASGVELQGVHVGMVDSPVYTQSGQGFGTELNFPDASGAYPEGAVQVSGLSAADLTDQPDAATPGGLSHGTQVAHVMAADAEGSGVVGVLGPAGDKVTLTMSNWTSGAQRWQSPGADPNDVTVYHGWSIRTLVEMKKQVDAGATVINLSLGTFGTGQAQQWAAAAYKRFFEQMQKDKPGVLFVTTAGNEGLALDGSNHGPGGFKLPNVITVGALDQTGDRAVAADWASPEEIQRWYDQEKAAGRLAPDWDIADYTAWLETTGGSGYATGDGEVTLSVCGTGVPVGLDADGRPVLVNGTSFAAPQVAAAAAMLRAINPALDADEIKQILVSTAGAEVTQADGTKVAVPDGMGAGVLRLDQAVLEVINQMRPKNDQLKPDYLLALATVTLVADGGPEEYTVTASITEVGAAGADLTISTTGEGTVTGTTTRHLSGPGEVSWTAAPKGGSFFIKVHRSDTGACARLTIEGPKTTPDTTQTGGTGETTGDMDLVPQGASTDGNGLITDMTITVRGGQVTASLSGPRDWLDRPGTSTCTITGTYDPTTGVFTAKYTGAHTNTREAGDIVQDVTITFSGTCHAQINPRDTMVQLNFNGQMTTEITGGPEQPPVDTRAHSLSIVCTIERF